MGNMAVVQGLIVFPYFDLKGFGRGTQRVLKDAWQGVGCGN